MNVRLVPKTGDCCSMTSVRPTQRTATLVFKFLLYGAMSIACMYMIYWFSAQAGPESSELSKKVAKVIAGIIYVGFDSLGQAEKLEVLSGISFNVRKVAHFSEYALLGACLTATFWQFVQLFSGDKAKVLVASVLAFLCSVAYACSDEYHQLFVADRSGEIKDVFIDSSGALVGILFIAFFLWLTSRAWKRRMRKDNGY